MARDLKCGTYPVAPVNRTAKDSSRRHKKMFAFKNLPLEILSCL